MCVQLLSHVWLFATPWTVASQTSLSLGFSRQEYWIGFPFPSPGDLPDPGIELTSPATSWATVGQIPIADRTNLEVLINFTFNKCLQPTYGLDNKNLPAMQETRVWSLVWEDPLEKEMVTHSSVLAWRIQWTEEPGRLQSMRLQRVRHDWVTLLSLSFSSSFRS